LRNSKRFNLQGFYPGVAGRRIMTAISVMTVSGTMKLIMTLE
jgi:hypothetical protein